MIQSLFTGKDISLRKEEKCASLSQDEKSEKNAR